MKESRLTPIIGLFSLLLVTFPSHAADWKLVWSDEFDKPGLPDATKWNYETGFIRNSEAQYYTRARKENARVENGMLVIEARKEHFANPDFDPAAKESRRARRSREFAEYTSASITTRGKASWTAGRIEVRAKLPAGRGTWPAIWTLGTNAPQVGWPACGEIDIMEFVGHEPGVIHANVHTKKYNHVQKNGKGGQLKLADASEALHIYALEWDSEHLDFFVDDHKYFTYANEKSGTDAWPFDKDQFLILNLAIGGAWGGQKGIDDTIFPQQDLIDYVRVYQRADVAKGEKAPETPKKEVLLEEDGVVRHWVIRVGELITEEHFLTAHGDLHCVVSYPKGVHHPQVDAKNAEEGVESVANVFWRNGRQMASTPQIGMKANGRDLAWWPNGNLAREAVFALGSPTGTWKFYDESGKFVGEGTYKNGKRYQGIFIGSDASGGGFFFTSYPMKLKTFSNGGFLNEEVFLKELKVE